MIWFIVIAALIILWLWAERGALLRDSTRRMVQISGWRRALNLATLHGYLYARFTYLYVWLGRRVAYLLWPGAKKWLANHYHGKVLPLELAQAVVTIREDIPRRDLEQIIPFPIARDLVLHGPPDVAAYECPCRATKEHPCQPTQVCMVIGQPFVDFMLEHHPAITRRLTTEEAAELLRAEHERGHIHTGWFKDASAGRFYAICNCCKCCCGGVEVMNKLGIGMMIPSGYAAQVDEALCAGCGACVAACPFEALTLADGAARLDWDKCLGCGVCEGRCPTGAMRLVRDEGKGIPLDVRALAHPLDSSPPINA